jgi:hypothetical protein
MHSFDKVVGLLREIAEENPNYVDPNAGDGCYYYDEGPSCIVGHVLSRLGYSNEVLMRMDDCFDPFFKYNSEAPLDHFDKDAIRLLSRVQTYQDSGETWMFSVNQAERDFFDEY